MPASDASSIRAHLERSHGTLLDIVIESALPFSLSKCLALLPDLDILAACPHCWHSLLVAHSDYSSDDDSEEEGDEILTHIIANRINHLDFPSLKSIIISSLCDIGYLDFLSIARALALKYLELEMFMTLRDILSPVANLKILKLNFEAGSLIDHLSCWNPTFASYEANKYHTAESGVILTWALFVIAPGRYHITIVLPSPRIMVSLSSSGGKPACGVILDGCLTRNAASWATATPDSLCPRSSASL